MVDKRLSVAALLLLGAAVTSGCESDKPNPNPAATASVDPHAGAYRDRNVEKAMAAAGATASANAGAGAGALDGPPPGGVFAIGVADQKQPPNAPPTVSIISAGSSPQIDLGGTFDVPEKTTLNVVVQKKLQRPLPPIAYTLSVATQEAGKTPGSPRLVQLKIEKVAGAQAGLPPEALKTLSAMSGSILNFEVAANGSVRLANMGIKKEADSPVTKQLVDGLREAIELLFLPAPAKPVGVGGTWMTSDRTSLSGMKAVRYRLAKLDKIDGDLLTMSVNVRQYLADQNQKPPIDQPNIVSAGFQSQGKGIIVRRKGQLMPIYAQVQVPSVVQLVSSENPKQGIPIQIEIAIQLGQPPGTAAPGGSAAPKVAKPPGGGPPAGQPKPGGGAPRQPRRDPTAPR